MSAEQEILREVNEGLASSGISVVQKYQAQIYKVSKVFGFDVFILFNVNPFGTVCFSNGMEKYYYRIHDVRPVLLNGEPSKELADKIKGWLVKRNEDFCLSFGEAACEERPSRVAP